MFQPSLFFDPFETALIQPSCPTIVQPCHHSLDTHHSRSLRRVHTLDSQPRITLEATDWITSPYDDPSALDTRDACCSRLSVARLEYVTQSRLSATCHSAGIYSKRSVAALCETPDHRASPGPRFPLLLLSHHRLLELSPLQTDYLELLDKIFKSNLLYLEHIHQALVQSLS
jgi:hypothetical protein